MSKASRIVLGAVMGTATLALVGCGPSPAYYEEPRTPAAEEVPLAEPREQSPSVEQQADVQVNAGGGGDVQVGGPAQGDVQIGQSADEYSETDPSALTEFKPALDGHGRWVSDSTYGTVWVPAESEVGTDFQPYMTAGHWTYSETDNWVWVSDYEWGWAPFHYGRWVYLNGYGWSWIPGRVYSGAWVEWRTGPYGYEYVGWAPMAPSWYWYDGYAVAWGWGWYHPTYWYCHRDYVYDRGVYGHSIRGGTPAAAPMEGRTSPYHPASPGVGGTGGRIAATPSVGGAGVGGRVIAQPGVNGTGSPGGSMGTRGAAGPKPADLGIASNKIPAPPTGNVGLARAQAMASPASARSLGASAPSTFRPRTASPNDMVAGRGPVERGMSPSVAQRIEPTARAPQYQGVPSHGTSSGASGRSFGSSSASSFNEGSHASPSYGSAPARSFSTSPSYGSSAPYRTPSSSPSFSPPVHSTSPSVGSMRSSSPPAVSHSSPSFGGHSAGSAVRSSSAPSVSHPSSSTHSSAPSHSSGSRGARGARR